MHLYPGTDISVWALLARTINDFLNREILTVWMLPVQQCGGNPDLVGHPDSGLGRPPRLRVWSIAH
jgi:hypothetical protein